MTKLRVLLPACITILAGSTSTALAWGQLGHSVIAELAQRHLTPAATTKLKDLIGETSLASISNWADDYKFTAEGKNTYRWHFVDIDVARATYDSALDCNEANNQGTCIVRGLPEAIAVLKDTSRSKDDRLRALKLVVHLAGDLEQPLHASERDGDQGGNKLHVILRAKRSDGTSYTRASTFHSMWDDSLIDLQAYSWGSYADAIDGASLPAVEPAPYDEARIAAWANDTHALGIRAYQLLPQGAPEQNDAGHPIELGAEYAAAVKSDLDGELAKGAARLKAILEDALGDS
ncbi:MULTISPECIES: S1/P1 nuclease [Bradyrhizobium]|uniref:S1/P1 nuclease n=2 Tax=Bradyrhizobium TaxID=374 RepID=A0A9X1UBX5_9BRAD|nr:MULTISPECIES: S1/P1 nuclease [Bradyrhizobium]MCG2632610.1 S1/P1 nuclease [Bradyrhizobium zhengyangense]MCG2645371.1 S1/P1 nuclease [Bradyrhizobium zhengyangense]MCG2672843.1 S1/P1 nuclease [Bradyrhizobium zhengyangense]MDN4985705.1 S1/P1 nuclease [Bradyrhizobium sp. WYCCWR 13022]MDT4740905.1 S1/P1 nuclease [Bradyrhizobium sp. WYCCWR 12699]